jgi:hypothetical protein
MKMKSAEEWVKEAGTTEGADWRDYDNLDLDTVNQIQLDAMREGMRRAATILDKNGTVYLHKLVCDALVLRKQAILSAAEQLTEKDLE